MSELDTGMRRRSHRVLRSGPVRRRIAAYRSIRSMRPPKRIPRAVVPSFFTLMNLFSGFLAIVQVHEGNLIAACWLIVLAGFFDMLDGFMARLARATSDFGVELDSLCDVVSFGVAPSFLVYSFGLQEYGLPGALISSLPAICGAVRLARFNISFQEEKKEYFSGLPIPIQAIAIVAFILTFHDPAYRVWVDVTQPGFLVPLVVILSALMISTVRFDGIPRISPAFVRREPWKAAALMIAVLLILVLREFGLLIFIVSYILFCLGRSMYYTFRVVWDETGSHAEENDF